MRRLREKVVADQSSVSHVSGQRSRFAAPGFSLLELLLFLGILGFISVVLITVFISTQDARIRQQGIAALEQRAGQLQQILTRRIRRAELIVSPAAAGTAGTLVLQMSQSEEHPTIFTQTGGNLYVIESKSISSILNDRLQLSSLSFKNVEDRSVIVSFDLSITLQLPTPVSYTRHFESAVTLFQQDERFSGGCVNGCAAPSCSGGYYQWYFCNSGTCTLTGGTALKC